MGAFFLYQRNKYTNLSGAQSVFKNKGFKHKLEFELGNYVLLLYNKILLKNPNYQIIEDNFIGVVGTFLYKGKCEIESLKLFYNDFKNSNVENNEIIGSFCLIIHYQSKLYIINDDENLYPVYVNYESKLVSSSFLAIAEQTNLLSINKLSLVENIITGCSFGIETYFNEINRFRWSTTIHLPNGIQNFPILKIPNKVSKPKKQEAFKIQQETINHWFNSFSLFGNKHGCEVGLSSGYDSRLLISLCLKHFDRKKIIIGSNYKKAPDRDLIVARKLAKAINIELNEIPVIATKDMTSEQLLLNIEKAFLFYDGQIRTNHGWTREYRTTEYRKKTLNSASIGLSGHAGELFRNDYNLDQFNFPYNSWILNNLIGYAGQKQIGSKKDLIQLVDYIKSKLSFIINSHSKFINISDAHKYYNEAWVQSGPGIRASIENQLSYYVSPFTDYTISKTAYKLVPFLKNAKFEKKIIEKNYPDFSNIPFEVKNRELLSPLFNTTITYRLGIDVRHFSRIFIKKKNKKLSNNLKKLIEKHKFLNLLFNNPMLENCISVERFINHCTDESELDRLIAFAFVFDHFKNKIITEKQINETT